MLLKFSIYPDKKIALEESTPSLVALAFRNYKEQASLFALHSCTFKLTTNLILERSYDRCVPLPRKLEMFLFQQAPPLDAISPNVPSCSYVDG